jgi:hypothetical protein
MTADEQALKDPTGRGLAGQLLALGDSQTCRRLLHMGHEARYREALRAPLARSARDMEVAGA